MCVKWRHKYETRKKNQHIKCNIITQAYRSRCSSETHASSKARIAQDFSHSPARQSKLTISSLFLKTMIFDFFLSSGPFLNHNPINKPAKNNKRNFESSCISFCRTSEKRHVKISQDDTKLCQLQLSVNKSQTAHKFSAWILFASSSPTNSFSLPFRFFLFPVALHLQANM